MRPSLREPAGRLLLAGFETAEYDEAEALLADFRPAGLIFFKRNYPGGPGALAALTARLQAFAARRLGRPLLMAIDHEGGRVQRLPSPFTQLPPAGEQGRRPAAETRALAARAGRELAAAGFNLNLAPVLDVRGPAGAFMGDRCYGDGPGAVAAQGQAAVAGYREAGILTCGKHFPGLGSATLDPHRELPAINSGRRALLTRDVAPFRALAARGLAAVMTTHALYPALDGGRMATFSPAVAALLKRGLAFRGALLTDDLEMGAVASSLPIGEAALAAIRAGHDLALVCRRRGNVAECAEALARAMDDGRLARARLADAHGRVAQLLHQQRIALWNRQPSTPTS